MNRAKKLFNYDYSNQTKTSKIITKTIIKPNNKLEKFNLIIGVISSNLNNLKELLKSFFLLYKNQGSLLDDYHFLVLDNSLDEYEIIPIINYFKQEKNIKIVSIKNYGNKSIACSRTILQTKIYKTGQKLFNNKYVSWIIDDDHLFDIENKVDYFVNIAKYTNTEIDALFGGVSDAPPLPFLSTLRTQLIDFYYNLIYFANSEPNAEFKVPNNEMHDEFYYDLSNNSFKHLEYPYYYCSNQKTNKEIFKNFLKQTIHLKDGVNIFRKLTFDTENIGKITQESICRGGNTIIFNQELLKTPNYTPKNEKYNRRSDFNWAIINKYIFNRKLYEIVLPLKHDRKLQKMPLLANKKKLEADIKGLIFYRALRELLSDDYHNKDFKKINKYYKKIQKNILLKVKINNYRIRNLLYLILNTLNDNKIWWSDNEYREDINYFMQYNISTIKVLLYDLGKRRLQTMLKELEKDMKLDDAFFENITKDIKNII